MKRNVKHGLLRYVVKLVAECVVVPLLGDVAARLVKRKLPVPSDNPQPPVPKERP